MQIKYEWTLEDLLDAHEFLDVVEAKEFEANSKIKDR